MATFRSRRSGPDRRLSGRSPWYRSERTLRPTTGAPHGQDAYANRRSCASPREPRIRRSARLSQRGRRPVLRRQIGPARRWVRAVGIASTRRESGDLRRASEVAPSPLERPSDRSALRLLVSDNLGSAAASRSTAPLGLRAVAGAASATSAAASSPSRKRATRRRRGGPRPGRGMSPFAPARPLCPMEKAIQGHPRPHARASARSPEMYLA